MFELTSYRRKKTLLMGIMTMANKPTISQEAFVELYATIGEAWLEDAYLDPLWDESDPENITYTEEAQDRFNEITDKLDGFFRQFLKVEGDIDSA
tara:strand:- start:3939 stop:4223 length:285 start_codon:yes stop_codon:yes gene_type:complete